MTPDARERMLVYQEGQRAFNNSQPCPYTDWRAKTWEKGRAAAEAYYNSVTQLTKVEQPDDVCPCCGAKR